MPLLKTFAFAIPFNIHETFNTFELSFIKLLKMETVTVRINKNSKRGKHLIALIADLAKLGDDIQLEEIPNSETVKAINDAHAKKGFNAKNVEDLFKQLDA